MHIRIMHIKIAISQKELNLKFMLKGGQSFRWQETRPGEWIGVICHTVWKLQWSQSEENVLKADAYNSQKSESDLKDEISNYLRLNHCIESLYQDWGGRDMKFLTTVKGPFLRGIRLLDQNPVENLFSFICSSNNNIARITDMVENLCKLFGQKLCIVSEKEYYSFPTIKRLAQSGVEEKLRQVSFGYRAPFIQKAAQQIMQRGGELWLFNLKNIEYTKAKAELMTLPGIGAKVADCICLMSLGHLQAVPVDTHVYQIAVKNYVPHLAGRKSITPHVYDEISNYFQTLFGPLAGWAHTVYSI